MKTTMLSTIAHHRRPLPWRAPLASLFTALLVAACGGGDDGVTAPATATPAANVRVTGLAATGAAIANAQVTGVNASGQRTTATTGTDGRFSIDLHEGAPYMLSIVDASGRSWYSYAQAAGVANLTPLTSLALAQASAGRALAEVFSGWNTSRLTAEQVLEAARKVNANLAAVMQARSVNVNTTNVFTHSFSANGQGLDAVLDAIRVSFNCSASCLPVINTPAGATLLTWNGNASIAGITLSWTAGGAAAGGGSTIGQGVCAATAAAGSYSMLVQTTISGFASVPVPEICVDGLPGKPASQSDFCGGSLATQQLPPGVSVLSCSFDGTVGTISARITTPLTIDYTIKYTFVQR